MSRSSLPDILLRSTSVTVQAEKQGGHYSLHLNSYAPQRSKSSLAGYAPGQNANQVYYSTHARAASVQSSRIGNRNISILKSDNSSTKNKIKGKLRVGFNQELIHLSNDPVNIKLRTSALNYTNFPYETDRKLNNGSIEQQQTQNLRNKIQNHFQQIQIMGQVLERCKRQNNETNYYLQVMKQTISNDLQDFQAYFSSALSQCYHSLSILRRQTREEIKSNKQEIQKVRAELQTCAGFNVDIGGLIDKIKNQCMKIQETQTKDSFKEQNGFDFQQISEVKRSSRGATGQTNRTRIYELLKLAENNRKSADLRFSSEKQKMFNLDENAGKLLFFEQEY